jgi:hypothetical protein
MAVVERAAALRSDGGPARRLTNKVLRQEIRKTGCDCATARVGPLRSFSREALGRPVAATPGWPPVAAAPRPCRAVPAARGLKRVRRRGARGSRLRGPASRRTPQGASCMCRAITWRGFRARRPCRRPKRVTEYVARRVALTFLSSSDGHGNVRPGGPRRKRAARRWARPAGRAPPHPRRAVTPSTCR